MDSPLAPADASRSDMPPHLLVFPSPTLASIFRANSAIWSTPETGVRPHTAITVFMPELFEAEGDSSPMPPTKCGAKGDLSPWAMPPNPRRNEAPAGPSASPSDSNHTSLGTFPTAHPRYCTMWRGAITLFMPELFAAAGDSGPNHSSHLWRRRLHACILQDRILSLSMS
jgi:hypothetical protein